MTSQTNRLDGRQITCCSRGRPHQGAHVARSKVGTVVPRIPANNRADHDILGAWPVVQPMQCAPAMRTALSVLVAILICSLSPSSARADGDDAPLSENTALALSLGGEVASVAMLVAPAFAPDNQVVPAIAVAGAVGTFVAPSFGHWYAGSGLWTKGMSLRAGGLAVAAIGSMALMCWDETCSTRPDRMPGALVPATGVVAWTNRFECRSVFTYPFGMGVQFLGPPPSQGLARLIARYRASAPA